MVAGGGVVFTACLLSFIHAQILMMSRGVFEGRHDHKDWEDGFDDIRRNLVGTPMAFVCCVLFVQGDWAEYAHTRLHECCKTRDLAGLLAS